MATLSNFETIPFGGLLENTKFNFQGLYMRSIYSGEGQNQADLIEPEAVTKKGKTAVNDWHIYDGPGPKANLVARAQGIHTFAGSWYNSMILSFDIGRFKGSTLQVMGRTSEDNKADDWAVVGGTGEFEMARGVIKRKAPEYIDRGTGQELTIYGYYKSPKAWKSKKFGPWGVHPGNVDKDVNGTPVRLDSITVDYGNILNSFQFTYMDSTGEVRTTEHWGTTGGKQETIQLSSSEYVTGVSGTYMDRFVSSIKFVTNKATYGPYGAVTGTAFQATVPDGSVVVGFFSRIGTHWPVKIGIYALEV